MGHLLALIFTPIAFWALTRIYESWRGDHSPEEESTPLGGVKSQVSDPVTPFDPHRGRGVVTTGRPPRGDVVEWIRRRAGRGNPSTLIKDAARTLRVSESTAKRAWRRVRGEKGGA